MSNIKSVTTMRHDGEASEPITVETEIPVAAVAQTTQTFVTKVQHAGKEPVIVTKQLVTTLNQFGKPESTIITDEK